MFWAKLGKVMSLTILFFTFSKWPFSEFCFVCTVLQKPKIWLEKIPQPRKIVHKTKNFIQTLFTYCHRLKYMSQILIKSKSCIGEQSSFVSLIRAGSQINIRIKENYRVGLHNSVFELGTFFGFINDFNQVNINNILDIQRRSLRVPSSNIYWFYTWAGHQMCQNYCCHDTG